jgi:hypothetical protein
MTVDQALGFMARVSYVVGVLIAAMAVLKLFSMPRADLLHMAAVSAACVFAGRGWR